MTASIDLPVSRSGSRRVLWITLGVVFITIAASVTYGWYRWRRWNEEWSRVGVIKASGGLYFQPRFVIPVPLFSQGDARWGADQLGATPGTLASEGCAVSSAAMVLASYGIDTDPGRLNKYLQEADGYTPEGWIYWEKAAEISGGKFEKAYEDLPSYQLIDINLQFGNPVIVRLRAKSGTTHFVVICGKDGYDYLTCDPGAGSAKGVYPLREYGSDIEALRFYRSVNGRGNSSPM